MQCLLTLPIISGVNCPTQYSCIQIEVQMLLGRGLIEMTRGAAQSSKKSFSPTCKATSGELKRLFNTLSMWPVELARMAV
jgi:hypothetical protein